MIKFANGEPTEPSDSTTAAIDVMSNPDNSVCPNKCFRPVGLVFGTNGRLYMSSDQTGEIYAIDVPKKKRIATPTRHNVDATTKKGAAVQTKNKKSMASGICGDSSSAHALAVALVAVCIFL